MEVATNSSNKHLNMAISSFRFTDLPAELRYKIYDYVKPGDWWHEYIILSACSLVNSSLKLKGVPPLFAASKWILLEAIDSLTKGTCKIEIFCNKVRTNFLLERQLLDAGTPVASTVDESSIRLPLCRSLSISIIPPVRLPLRFMRTRRNVARVVKWVNSWKRGNLPSLDVKLDISDGFSPVYNDFIVLMGPLSLLRGFYTHANVSGGTGYKFDAQIEEHRARLEMCLNGDSVGARRTIEYQQAMLDIRLPIADQPLLFNGQPREQGPGEQISQHIRAGSADHVSLIDIQSGIERMQSWCNVHGGNHPPWLERLGSSIKNESITEREAKSLFDEVLSPGRAREYEFWMIGLSTGFDPFQLV